MGSRRLHPLRFTIVVTSILIGARDARGQAVTVQQPALRSFSTSTTVTVPDRGSAHLGSSSSAASGRVTPGLFRPGTSSGLDRSASSARVSVFIHDLSAMDEAMLSQGASTNESEPWSARLNERRAGIRGRFEVSVEDNPSKAARYEQLARDAEAKQKRSTARLHWQVAEKLGSTVAKQRLVSLKP